MKILNKKTDEGIVIEYAGELGHHEAMDAMRYIENIVDLYSPDKLTLDFSGLKFMDSSGIAVVMCAYRNIRDIGGLFVVKNTPVQAKKVLFAAGVDKLVKIV